MAAKKAPQPSDIASVIIALPSDGPAYLPGVRLLAVLAHPPLTPQDSRWRQAERALGRIVCMAHEQIDQRWLQRPQQVIPDHLTISEKQALAEDKRIRKLLHHRMGAAHVALPYFREAAARQAGEPGRRGSRGIDDEILRTLEQEQARRERLGEVGIDAVMRFPEQHDNFDPRVLRKSLPVIHLAVAVSLVIDASQKAFAKMPPEAAADAPSDVGGPQISIADIMLNPSLAASIIQRAAELETMLPHLSVLRPSAIVRVVVA